MLNCAWKIGSRSTDADPPYEVTFIEYEQNIGTISIADDTFILDAAFENNYEFPYQCLAGVCTTCVMRLVSGSVDQGDQSALDQNQIDAGFFTPCVAYPTSDIVATIREEDNL